MKNQMTMIEIRRHFNLRNRREASQEAERLDHRGRSNDDCPLIVGLQEELKEAQDKLNKAKIVLDF
jgi:hypothetical protein